MTEHRARFVVVERPRVHIAHVRLKPTFAFRVFVLALQHDGFWLGLVVGACLASLPWVVLR